MTDFTSLQTFDQWLAGRPDLHHLPYLQCRPHYEAAVQALHAAPSTQAVPMEGREDSQGGRGKKARLSRNLEASQVEVHSDMSWDDEDELIEAGLSGAGVGPTQDTTQSSQEEANAILQRLAPAGPPGPPPGQPQAPPQAAPAGTAPAPEPQPRGPSPEELAAQAAPTPPA